MLEQKPMEEFYWNFDGHKHNFKCKTFNFKAIKKDQWERTGDY